MKLAIHLYLPLANVVLLLVPVARCGAGTNSSAPLPATSALGPHIEFAVTTHDCGAVKPPVASYEFVLTNTGDAMLVCSASTDPEMRVAPGQTGKIPVQVNISRITGPFLKLVPVHCNDANHPSIMLEFKGTVWRPIVATPMYLVFDAVIGAVTNETKITRIVNITDEPVTLSAPECREPSFKPELKTVIPGKEFELSVTRMPPFAEVSAPITITTSCKEMPTLTIFAVKGSNSSPAHLQPLPSSPLRPPIPPPPSP